MCVVRCEHCRECTYVYEVGRLHPVPLAGAPPPAMAAAPAPASASASARRAAAAAPGTAHPGGCPPLCSGGHGAPHRRFPGPAVQFLCLRLFSCHVSYVPLYLYRSVSNTHVCSTILPVSWDAVTAEG